MYSPLRCTFLAFFVLAALPAVANTAGCGENAFTFAEVETRGGTRARGPVTTVPDSLCADLIEDRKSGLGSLSLQVGDPSSRATRGRGAVGGGRGGTAR
jgi:hypothetical protein